MKKLFFFTITVILFFTSCKTYTFKYENREPGIKFAFKDTNSRFIAFTTYYEKELVKVIQNDSVIFNDTITTPDKGLAAAIPFSNNYPITIFFKSIKKKLVISPPKEPDDYRIINIYKNKKRVYVHFHDVHNKYFWDYNPFLIKPNAKKKDKCKIISIDTSYRQYYLIRIKKRKLLKCEIANLMVQKEDEIKPFVNKIEVGKTYKIRLLDNHYNIFMRRNIKKKDSIYFYYDDLPIWDSKTNLKFYETFDLDGLYYDPK
jgi:hypothetical protein